MKLYMINALSGGDDRCGRVVLVVFWGCFLSFFLLLVAVFQAQTRNCPAIKPALEITPTVCNNVDLLNHSSPCRHRKRDGSATQTTSSHNSFIATVDLCESHAERLALMRGSWPIDPHLDANLVRDPHTREMGYGEDSTDLFSLEEIDAPHHQPRER
ncbi:hypothetical protein QYF36_015666 [Acer negundo]|nr:hypothetical protein QYF36_015666 [Acer negundo]